MLQESMLQLLRINYKRGSVIMKNLIKNCFATTGLTLITLAIVASIYGGKFLFVSGVYQSFMANLIIHIGVIILQKFENKYIIIEIFVEVSYVLTILVIFGYLFGWYSSTPLWVIILMGIIVYAISSVIDIMKINQDVVFINEHLKKRKENMHS